jgi:hypothetical protein
MDASCLGDLPKVVHRERDVLHVDVDGVGEAFGRDHRDQVRAHRGHPDVGGHLAGDGVAGQQRHGDGLGDLFREPACQARLPQLRVDRQPVPGLELDRGGPVGQHLGRQGPAEREHLVVRGFGQESCAPEDAALAVQVTVGAAGHARLELVRPPSHEGKVRVAVHEPG